MLATTPITQLSSLDRAKLRKQRLNDIQREQRIEDRIALLKLSEPQEVLFQSFETVKTEFSDLDGLCWTRSALFRRRAKTRKLGEIASTTELEQKPSVAILSDDDLATFSPEETIRPSRRHSRLFAKRSSLNRPSLPFSKLPSLDGQWSLVSATPPPTPSNPSQWHPSPSPRQEETVTNVEHQ